MRKRCLFGSICLALWVLFLGAQGMAADEALLEKRAQQLEKEIVAPCCWNNTLDQHHSEVAYQLKRKIRFLLGEGKSEATVRELLVSEFDERILAKPRARGFTLLAWVTPPAVLLLVLFAVGRYLRSRMANRLPKQESSDSGEVREEERRQVEEELAKVDPIG